jgi:hypothetical protein
MLDSCALIDNDFGHQITQPLACVTRTMALDEMDLAAGPSHHEQPRQTHIAFDRRRTHDVNLHGYVDHDSRFNEDAPTIAKTSCIRSHESVIEPNVRAELRSDPGVTHDFVERETGDPGVSHWLADGTTIDDKQRPLGDTKVHALTIRCRRSADQLQQFVESGIPPSFIVNRRKSVLF